MKKLFLLLIFTFMVVSLEAYSKRIVLVSLSTQERADNLLKTFPSSNPSLYALAAKNNFGIKYKKQGKYYVVTAEVFTDEEVLNLALEQIRKVFKGAYVRRYTYPKIEPTIEKKPSIKIVKEIEKPIKQKKVIEKKKEVIHTPEIKTPALEQVASVETQAVKEESTQSSLDKLVEIFTQYYQWVYLFILILFIMFIIALKYVIKLKRLYDKY